MLFFSSPPKFIQGSFNVFFLENANSRQNAVFVPKRDFKKENIEEVIVATSATVEGQTTAFYIEDKLKDTNVKITKLAQGLPVGGEIESLDDGTLFSAFNNRKSLENNSD